MINNGLKPRPWPFLVYIPFDIIQDVKKMTSIQYYMILLCSFVTIIIIIIDSSVTTAEAFVNDCAFLPVWGCQIIRHNMRKYKNKLPIRAPSVPGVRDSVPRMSRA